jgi:hypothetical protein
MGLDDIVQALRSKVSQYTSLEPQQEGLGDMATQMGLSLIPGVGQAMAGRDFERARRDDDYLGMGLSAASLIPGGALLKALRGGGEKLGIIAGRTARNAPHDALHEAQLAYKNIDDKYIGSGRPQQTWDQNKAYMGPDGTMKWEISDLPSRLRDPNKTVYDSERLSDVLDHPELFKNYPDLGDTIVHGDITKTNNGGGGFSPRRPNDAGDFNLITNRARNPEEFHSTLLHEIQHNVQEYENWSRGANYDNIHKRLQNAVQGMPGGVNPKDLEQLAQQKYLRNMGEAEARAVEQRWKLMQGHHPGMVENEVPSHYYDQPDTKLWSDLLRQP